MTEQTPQHLNPARKLLRLAARAIWITLVTIAMSLSAVLVIIGIGAIFSIYVMGPFILYSFAFLAMLLMAWSTARLAIRRRRMLLVLNTLSSATRLDLPLSKLLHDAAQGETGLMRNRLLAVHDRLQRGESLEDALLRAAPAGRPTAWGVSSLSSTPSSITAPPMTPWRRAAPDSTGSIPP